MQYRALLLSCPRMKGSYRSLVLRLGGGPCRIKYKKEHNQSMPYFCCCCPVQLIAYTITFLLIFLWYAGLILGMLFDRRTAQPTPFFG